MVVGVAWAGHVSVLIRVTHVHRLIAGYHSARMFRTLKGTSWKNAAALVSGWIREESYLSTNIPGSTENIIVVYENGIALGQYPLNFDSIITML